MEIEKMPKVGVGAVILDENSRIILVLRKKSPAAGYWSLPGEKLNIWKQ
ncbi:NUDIX domain-containing protein [Paenibacillus lautus]